jgi:hypothetical protein
MNVMMGQAAPSGPSLLAGLLPAVLALAVFAFWLWMLIDALTNKGLQGTEKIVWVLVVILVPCIGSLIYFFIGRPKGGR